MSQNSLSCFLKGVFSLHPNVGSRETRRHSLPNASLYVKLLAIPPLGTPTPVSSSFLVMMGASNTRRLAMTWGNLTATASNSGLNDLAV
jgi:hypothetical protein